MWIILCWITPSPPALVPSAQQVLSLAPHCSPGAHLPCPGSLHGMTTQGLLTHPHTHGFLKGQNLGAQPAPVFLQPVVWAPMDVPRRLVPLKWTHPGSISIPQYDMRTSRSPRSLAGLVGEVLGGTVRENTAVGFCHSQQHSMEISVRTGSA